MEFPKLYRIKENERLRFLFTNLMKGLLWLIILVGLFIYIKNNIDLNYVQWLSPLYDNPLLMYLIFLTSEVIFGIIPPEIFMVWAVRSRELTHYMGIISFLAVLSYLAGIVGFWVGVYLDTSRIYRYLKRKVFGKYEYYLNKFGVFVIMVASLTPIPYSGISMLIGSVRYPFNKFLLYSSMRFVRFGLYSYIIWQAHFL